MFIGAVENAPLTSDPLEAKAKVDLARLAGFDTLRVSMFWKRGNGSVIPAPDVVRLQNAAQAAQLDGMRLIVSVSNYNSRDTPLTYLASSTSPSTASRSRAPRRTSPTSSSATSRT